MDADRDYLAAGLALGGLSPEDQATAEDLRTTDADFRALVTDYEDTMAGIAEADEPVTPSASVTDAILTLPRSHPRPDESTPSASTAVPTEPAPTSSREAAPEGVVVQLRRRARAAFAVAAAAVVGLLIAGGSAIFAGSQQREAEEDLQAAQTREASLQELLGAEDLETETVDLGEAGVVKVAHSRTIQAINVTPERLDVEPGTSLQMWVIGADGPKSAGLMADGSTLVTAMPFAEGSAFGVTVEPEGGSDAPSSDPLAVVNL